MRRPRKANYDADDGFTKVTPSKKDSSFDKDLYSAVVDSAILEDLRLTHSSFDWSPELLSILHQHRDDLNAVLKLIYECDVDGAHYSVEDGMLFCFFSWKAVGKISRKHLITTKASYVTIYRTAPNLDETNALIFVRKVGRFATYPYFRALAAMYAGEGQLDLPPLPVLK